MVLAIRSVGLWYLTPRSIIFQLYRGGQSYWWRKPGENHRLLTNLSNNVVSSTPRHERGSNPQLAY